MTSKIKGTYIFSFILGLIAVGVFIYEIFIEKIEINGVETIRYDTQGGYVLFWLILWLSYIFISVYIVFHYKKDNKRLLNENKRLEGIKIVNIENDRDYYKNELKKYSKDENPHTHKRFEEIVKKGSVLKYITIDYKPFFWINDNNESKGIGYDVMKKIFEEPFNIELKDKTRAGGYNWETIFNDFSTKKRKELDFIMTPMYETRTRLYNYDVIYSIPLFYSDIGIYVRKDTDTKDLKLPYDKAIKFIKNKIKGKDKWKIEYLEGEISEILGKKLTEYEEQEENKKTIYEHYNYRAFKEKLENVASTNKNTPDVIFMEIFKAQEIIEKENHNIALVNILQDNQLVYPVSFVIHKEETVLRNFINLRIAELRKNGELRKIIKSNAFEVEIKKQHVIDKVFLQTYNYKLIKEDYNENQILFSDRIKEEYDILNNVYGNYIKFQEKIVTTIKEFRKNEKLNVLEIGCGTGITSKILLEARNNFEKVILLDNDEEMIRATKTHINTTVLGENRQSVEYCNSDILEFLKSYNGKPFDLVISGYTIHNFNNDYRVKLFENLFEKMSTNSLIINADKYAHNDEDERIDALKYRINKFTDYLKTHKDKYDVVEEWISHYINDMSEDKVMTQKASEELLNKLKFSDIKIDVPDKIKAIEMMAILTAKKI